jgi:hypothetical protein
MTVLMLMSGRHSSPSRLMSTCPSLSMAGWKTCVRHCTLGGSLG